MPMAEVVNIGERVKAAREDRSWSQQELAGRAGIAISVISKLEQGKTPDPRFSTVKALADAFGLTLDELAGTTG